MFFLGIRSGYLKDIVYFLKQVYQYAGWRLFASLIAVTIVSLLDGIAILLLIPLIHFTGMVDFGLENSFLSSFSLFEHVPSSVVLPLILLIFVVIVAVHHLIEKAVMIKHTRIQMGFLTHLRMSIYQDILLSNWSFFLKKSSSDLIHTVLTEIAKTSGGTRSILQLCTNLIFAFVQIGMAFILSPYITSFVLLLGMVAIYMNRKYLKLTQAFGKQNYTLGKKFLAGITDQLGGIKEIKSNHLEEAQLRWAGEMTAQMQEEQVNYMNTRLRSQLNYKISLAVFIAVFVYLSIQLFQAQSATLLLIVVIFSRLWPRVAGIQSSLEQITTAIPSFKAVKLLQSECKQAREELISSDEKLKLENSITYQQVSFRYVKEKYALKDINVTIPSKKMTAIVGKSGAGKSTFVDLLMGLNQPQEGALHIDGQKISNHSLALLRQSIGYVSQEPFLFNGTIRENLLLLRPNATDQELWQALSFASAADFVKKLPESLDTYIGDRGIKLSGGEKQRLVLARVILKDPLILILDEATSSLDTENEKNIQESIEQLKGKMTIIVIAHRLSTIRDADQVIVLDEGKVVQVGEFVQLSKDKNQLFSQLLQRQVEAM